VIRYQLVCKCEHQFESWFRSGDDYDHQQKEDLLWCPACGSSKVCKALMAPNVKTGRNEPQAPQNLTADIDQQKFQDELRTMRDQVTQTSEYVGDNFTSVARKMHYGDEPERKIYGEAKLKDVKDLNEEGITVLPLPSLPEDKN